MAKGGGFKGGSKGAGVSKRSGGFSSRSGGSGSRSGGSSWGGNGRRSFWSPRPSHGGRRSWLSSAGPDREPRPGSRSLLDDPAPGSWDDREGGGATDGLGRALGEEIVHGLGDHLGGYAGGRDPAAVWRTVAIVAVIAVVVLLVVMNA